MNKNIFEKEVGVYLPLKIRKLFYKLDESIITNLTEIRMTVDSPLRIEYSGIRVYIAENGVTHSPQKAYQIQNNDINQTIELITCSSIYAYNRYINEGYVTLPYGHRVGITGTCAMDGNEIKSVKNFNSLNFRISHHIRGIADIIFSEIYNTGRINNTLIISPPGCGKTTLLKDIVHCLNNRAYVDGIINTSVVDERFELSNPSFFTKHYWTNTSVICGCPKYHAIAMLIRSMSPDVIVVDELSGNSDAEAIKYASASGCSIIGTSHGYDEYNNEISLMDLSDVFKKIIILSKKRGPGTIERIIGGD